MAPSDLYMCMYWMMRCICVQTRYLPIRMIRHSSYSTYVYSGCIRIWHFCFYRNCPDWIRILSHLFHTSICVYIWVESQTTPETKKKRKKNNTIFPCTIHNVLAIIRVDQSKKIYSNNVSYPIRLFVLLLSVFFL